MGKHPEDGRNGVHREGPGQRGGPLVRGVDEDVERRYLRAPGGTRLDIMPLCLRKVP